MTTPLGTGAGSPVYRPRMLGTKPVVSFVPTVDADRARRFYEGVLGLRFVEDNGFSLRFDVPGGLLRVSRVQELAPQPFTIVGWEVEDVAIAARALGERGVS